MQNIKLSKERKEILKNYPRPNLKKGTRSWRIYQMIKSHGECKYKEIFDNESRLNPDIRIDPNLSQLIARMHYYGIIWKIDRGLYSLPNNK